jgi:hypothetical protein
MVNLKTLPWPAVECTLMRPPVISDYRNRGRVARKRIGLSAFLGCAFLGVREFLSTWSLRIQAQCELPTRTCGIR